MARPSNTKERREQIVSGLLAVMAKEGYEAASVAEIARAASLTPGLVHYHFGSKREILVALVERLSAGVDARLERRLGGARDAKAKLRAFIEAHLALGDDADAEAMAAWVAIGAEAIRQPEVREVYRDAVVRGADLLATLVRERLEEEGRETRNARALAGVVMCAIEGAYAIGTAAPDALPRGFAATTMTSVLEAAVLAAPKRKGAP